MKVEYRYSERDHKFLNKMKEGDAFSQLCVEIQKIWLKIHACKSEMINLYCKQAGLKNKEDSEWGICINDMSYIPERMFDCGVGQVRKMRNHVLNACGTCKTCPYYIKEEDIKNIYRERQ